MRVKNTMLNMAAGLGNQLIITVLSFISRTVFINSLGIEYLGINALFTSILAMLSLAEAGIGSSIIYNLYKPVADNDQSKIHALMRLYKRSYIIIAGIVMLLGLGLLPFLDVFIKDTTVDHLVLIYLLFLVNTAAPYLFVYKHSFLNVNQKNYIVTSVFSVSFIISTCIKIVILYFTENYILFLIIESSITITTSIILALVVDKMYPFLKLKTNSKLDQATRANFIKNMKAIVLQNIGTYFIFGVDSILISSFISIAAVGLYSNYKMLIEVCRSLVNQVFLSMYHSIGNLVAKESSENIYRIYRVTMLLNFWLYSLCAIGLYLLTESLIKLWLGEQFIMGHPILIILVITFYERGMRNSITTVKNTAGIFHEDRYSPLSQAVINLGVSLILVQYIGITGIFIGSLVSALAVPFWLTPYLVYKKVFLLPLHKYYLVYILYAVVGVVACLSVGLVGALVPTSTPGWIALQTLLCIVLINIVYIIVFHRTEEFKYLLRIAHGLLRNLPFINSFYNKSSKRDRKFI